MPKGWSQVREEENITKGRARGTGLRHSREIFLRIECFMIAFCVRVGGAQEIDISYLRKANYHVVPPQYFDRGLFRMVGTMKDGCRRYERKRRPHQETSLACRRSSSLISSRIRNFL